MAVILLTDLVVISLLVQIVAVVVVLLLLFIAAPAATASLLYMRGVVFCPDFVIQFYLGLSILAIILWGSKV